MEHPIPPADFMGNQVMWCQPKREDILVDEEFAVMSQETFEALMEYSRSIPTGAYDGKMWKRLQQHRTLLCWFAPTDYLDRKHVCFRIIRIMDWKNLMGI